jgi:hypothetical protein
LRLDDPSRAVDARAQSRASRDKILRLGLTDARTAYERQSHKTTSEHCGSPLRDTPRLSVKQAVNNSKILLSGATAA